MMLQPGSRPVPNSPDYVLVRQLGAGAFGQVWHAHGPGGLDVALKFIPHVPAHELRSLNAMKSIRHLNLVSVFGVWHKDDWLILAMEQCDRSLLEQLQDCMAQPKRAVLLCPKCGQNVRVAAEHDRLRLTCPTCRHGWDWTAPPRGIPLDELLPYMNDAASGLDALNSKQVQHRDVKPANLLLLNGGVKVADFGLAKALEHTVGSNSGPGTLAYTAPESFKGQLAQQSDQYSLAVTYFHLRTGRLLFDGDQAKVMYGHLELKPDLSCLPLDEQVVLARALSKEPAKRWPDCKTLVSRLVGADPSAPECWDWVTIPGWDPKEAAAAFGQAYGDASQDHGKAVANQKAKPERQRPVSESAQAQQNKVAVFASELCWFCKTNEANGKPAGVNLCLGQEHKTTIEVARCAPCEHRQRHHKLLVFCLAAVVIVLGAWGVWTLGDPDPPYAFKLLQFSLLWFTVAGPLIFMLACELLRKLQQRTVTDFPLTKAKLDAGWQFAPFW